MGASWTVDAVDRVAANIADAGLQWSVVESFPLHEQIKLGLSSRDSYIYACCESLRQVARVGVPVVCNNFMPVFDWTRSDLAVRMADGSTALA